MLRCLVILLPIVLMPIAGAEAQGFATMDLTGIEASISSVLGPGCVMRAEPKQLTGTCQDDPGEPIASIQLGRQLDGTEQRVRSGATSMADLERLCQARSAACTLSAVDVAPAVGWLTAYPLGGGSAGATVIMIRDGDLLTLRCIANHPVPARALVERLLPVLRARVVGP